MAIFSNMISPSVEIHEYDLTTGVDVVATSIGGYAGAFEWGPINYIRNLSNTKDLENVFGLPSDSNASDWFCAYNFLTYSNYLKCVRVMDDNAANAVAVADIYGMSTDNGFVGDASFHEIFGDYNENSTSGVLIKNPDDFEKLRNTSDLARSAKIIAKYPGEKGNSLKVSICDGGTAFDVWEYRSYFSGAARKITVDKIYHAGLISQDENTLDLKVTEFATKVGDSIKKKVNTAYVVDANSGLKGNFTVGSPYIRDITDMSDIRAGMDVYLSWGKGGNNPITQKVGKILSIVNKNTVRLVRPIGVQNTFEPQLFSTNYVDGNPYSLGYDDKADFKMMGDTYIYDDDGEKIPLYYKHEPQFSDPDKHIVPESGYFKNDNDSDGLPFIMVVPVNVYGKKDEATGKRILTYPKGTVILPDAVVNKTAGVEDIDYTNFSENKIQNGENLVEWKWWTGGSYSKEELEEVSKNQIKNENEYAEFNRYNDVGAAEYVPVVRYKQRRVNGDTGDGIFGVYSANFNPMYANADDQKNDIKFGMYDKNAEPETFIPSDQKFKINFIPDCCVTDSGKYIVGVNSSGEQKEYDTEYETKLALNGYVFQFVKEGEDDIKVAITQDGVAQEKFGNLSSVEGIYAIEDVFGSDVLSDGHDGSFHFTSTLQDFIDEDITTYGNYVLNNPVPLFTAAQDEDGDYLFMQYFSDNLTSTDIPINFGVQLTKKITRVSGRPDTSAFAAKHGAEKDELCVVVVDEDGKFTGIAGTILERYENLSKCSDARSPDGANNYWVDVINTQSEYICIPYDFFNGTGAFSSKKLMDWGVPAFEKGNSDDTVFDCMDEQPLSLSLDGGWYNPYNINSGNRMDGFECFSDPQAVDVNLLIGGVLTENIADYLVDDIAENRRDCVVLLSPPLSANLTTDPLRKVLEFRNLVNDSTYAIWDSGWKTQYDKYNDVVRYVPLCADVAGLCARTDADRGCHWSPAGYNRGLIKNVNALVWNVENKDDRDELYQMGINPFMTVIGTGTLMFGDRTGTTRKTAFREIGIRRWFMKIEKAIANYAKYVLFEFNDAFTRSQFINVVNPYMRNEQGARACQDYVIQCDEQVNTPEVIDAQGFVANFLIKPMHSINFIQLNFAAVATGASFEEIELY